MATSNAELVRELYQALEAKDLEAIDRLGGDAPFENVSFHETPTLREDSAAMIEAFADLKIEVHSMVEQGNLVVVEGTGHGTHQGTLRTPSGNVPPTGRQMALRFVDVYECADGRITSGRFYIDRMSVFEQLGIGAEAPRDEAGAPAPA